MDPQVPPQEAPQIQESSSKKWIFIILVIVLLLIVGCALGYYYFFSTLPQSVKTTSVYPNNSSQPSVSSTPLPTTPMQVQNPFSSPTSEPTVSVQNPFVPPAPTVKPTTYQNPFDTVSQ